MKESLSGRPNRVVSRRRVLAGAGAVSTIGLAGCSDIAQWAVEQAFQDVNLVNDREEDVAGEIHVTGPDGEDRLDESFEVEGDGTERFSDVWSDTGEYTVGVETEDGLEESAEMDLESTEDYLAVNFEPDSIDISWLEPEDE